MLWLAAGAQAQTLERVRDAGMFKIGYREGRRTLSFRDTPGDPSGFSVKPAELVLDSTGR